MANKKDTALTENTAPLGSDLERMVDDPNGTPLSQKIYKGSNNLLPDGHMINGKISVTVASNNITVALKTKSGGNPSTTDPVSVYINGTYRRCTAALSVTKNAGTDWFGSGGSMFATLEREYFVYLIWNTTPGTDIMDIGFSAIPYGRVYSDFSATGTAQNYLAYANASAPTSTDSVTVVGRFAATLSAGAGYTWSVPTFTNDNLIQFPIYETNWLSYVPTWTGFSAAPSAGIARYKVLGDTVTHNVRNVTAGTSNATTMTYSLPFTAKTLTNANWQTFITYEDNGSVATSAGRAFIASAGAVATCHTNASTGTWTGSSTKRIVGMAPFMYEIR